MRVLGLVFTLVLLLLIGGMASAQEGKGWIGADVLDVTKAEADKLGWDTPHGAKLGVVESGSPADKAGLKTGDVIVAVDRTMLDTSAEVEAAITAKPPGFTAMSHSRGQIFRARPLAGAASCYLTPRALIGVLR
jgi:membrane-associated protease RseP (regulator of RpoE activity)